MNPIDWLRNYAFDTHLDRGDSLTECHLEQSTEFSMILETLEKELEAARRARKDTERLNWVLDCIGLDEPIPTRDWMDNNDARAAIDEAIAAQEGVTKP